MNDAGPELFLDAVLSYQKTAVIKAALELDLFSSIGSEGATAAALAASSGAAERGVRIVCDYLVVQGLLEKDGARYRNTPAGALFLDRRSPACMASIVDFLASPEMIGLFLDDPAAYVRQGGSPGLANVAPDNPVWIKFAKAMVPFIAPRAQAVAAAVAAQAPRKVLDIAAGHGLFGIAIAAAVPGAHVTAIDWAAVLDVARANARAAGVEARWHAVPGSAFEVDWGRGHDVVLMPNFLHHFDREGCEDLLRRARASLAPGGQVLLVEMVPNDDRVSPPFPAMFALMMLGTTPRGDAYTLRELEAMGRAAGFTTFAAQPLPPSPQTLVTLS